MISFTSDLGRLGDKLIGSGIRFPNIFNSSTGSTATVSGTEKIQQSIDLLLKCPQGIMLFKPNLGSIIMTSVFDQNDYILADILKINIAETVEKALPMISVVDIRAIPNPEDEQVIRFLVEYQIKNSNIRGTYTYDYRKPNQ